MLPSGGAIGESGTKLYISDLDYGVSNEDIKVNLVNAFSSHLFLKNGWLFFVFLTWGHFDFLLSRNCIVYFGI